MDVLDMFNNVIHLFQSGELKFPLFVGRELVSESDQRSLKAAVMSQGSHEENFDVYGNQGGEIHDISGSPSKNDFVRQSSAQSSRSVWEGWLKLRRPKASQAARLRPFWRALRLACRDAL